VFETALLPEEWKGRTQGQGPKEIEGAAAKTKKGVVNGWKRKRNMEKKRSDRGKKRPHHRFSLIGGEEKAATSCRKPRGKLHPLGRVGE